MSAVEEIKQRVLALDVPGLDSTLDRVRSVDPDRGEARAWVLRDRHFFPELQERSNHAGEEGYSAAAWMRVMCLIALCPPVEAARAMRWGPLWDGRRPAARDRAATLLAERPRAWAEAFLAATAEVKLSASEARHVGESLDRFVEQGLAAHGLPCPPEGRTFVEHHLLGTWRDPVHADQVRRDRIGAEVVYLKIRFGLAVQLAPLTEAMPALVEDGTLDRSRLIDLCLESLTVETRPTSERVVARILTALELQPSEIPGGLAYLAGVIATRDGAVGASLLPLALDLVVEVEGLLELARVLAGRKERKQKQTLLAALRGGDLQERVGVDGVLAAADVLAVGLEDASLLRGLEALNSELGRAQHLQPAAAPTGLWGLVLAPGPRREWPQWMVHHSRVLWDRSYDWPVYLDRAIAADPRAYEFTVDEFLQHIAAEGPDRFEDRCRRLRLDGRLGLNRLVRLVEPAFLAGGLSVLWPAVLGVAEEIASSGTAVAGMPELLRLLTRYAADVPDGWALSPALACLAASKEATKARIEADALRAALARTGEAPTGGAAAARPRPRRGLWDHRVPVPVLPRALERQSAPELNQHTFLYVRAMTTGELDRVSPSQRSRASCQLIWSDEGLVRTLALAVQGHGVEPVRRLFADVAPARPVGSGPVNEALELWAQGDLTSDTYWGVLEGHRGEGPPLDQVVFAWACEQLVRLPSHPGHLSSPGRADGTVTASALAVRVRALEGLGLVGPLDLLLAMTRLTAGLDDAEAADSLIGAELWTDPAVTRTRSGSSSFDVVPLLRDRIRNPSGELDLAPFWPITEAGLSGKASHDDVVRRVRPQTPRFDEPDHQVFQARPPVRLHNGSISSAHWASMLGELFNPHTTQGGRRSEQVVMFANLGVLDPEITVPVALDRLRAGKLPLSGLVELLQFVFERGGLHALWPVGLAVAAAACGTRRKPHGLPNLLACLVQYAPEVPLAERAVPPELGTFAEEPGRTKSHAAARELVAVLSSREGTPE